MKKALALVLSLVLCLGVFAGCGEKTPAVDASAPATGDSVAAEPAAPQTISVVSSYGGDDGNRVNFEEGIAGFEAATGNTVKENSGKADEAWKAQVHTDFEAGGEPDVLFFFNGVDSDPLIKNNKMVSVKEIRAEYPDYASNMDDGRMAASSVDGETYFIPVNGYWEGMFYNTAILEKAGVAAPGADYNMDTFMADCAKIKEAGFVPVACSLQEVPHYWFEFLVLNYTTPANHLTLPKSGDATAANWAKALDDFKKMYEAGCFPTNTTTASDAETCQIFFDGKAAFLCDGSWKTGGIAEVFKTSDEDVVPATFDEEGLEPFDVTYPPCIAANGRKATDLIGGISMGYGITRKAWDSERRAACVAFVEYMTSDEQVSKFCGAVGSNALKAGSTAATANSLEADVVEMIKGATSFTGAVQDTITGEQKKSVFDNVKNVCAGSITSTEAIEEMLTK